MKSLIVKDENFVISESMVLDYLRIYPKLNILACEGKTVTMVLNGHAERILPGEYEGHIELIVRDAITRNFEFGGGKAFTYRTGLYIENNQLIPENRSLRQ